MLLSPKLAPDFSYENHPLSIEEDIHPPYYFESGYRNCERVVELNSHEPSSTLFRGSSTLMTVMDLKSYEISKHIIHFMWIQNSFSVFSTWEPLVAHSDENILYNTGFESRIVCSFYCQASAISVQLHPPNSLLLHCIALLLPTG